VHANRETKDHYLHHLIMAERGPNQSDLPMRHTRSVAQPSLVSVNFNAAECRTPWSRKSLFGDRGESPKFKK